MLLHSQASTPHVFCISGWFVCISPERGGRLSFFLFSKGIMLNYSKTFSVQHAKWHFVTIWNCLSHFFPCWYTDSVTNDNGLQLRRWMRRRVWWWLDGFSICWVARSQCCFPPGNACINTTLMSTLMCFVGRECSFNIGPVKRGYSAESSPVDCKTSDVK